MDLDDFFKAMITGERPGKRKELSRARITAMEREAQIASEEAKDKLYREAKRFERDIRKRMTAAHDLAWDIVAKRHGYQDNQAAIKDGIMFALEGEGPIDEDDEDTREVVVYDTRADRNPEPEPTKKPRFVMPN